MKDSVLSESNRVIPSLPTTENHFKNISADFEKHLEWEWKATANDLVSSQIFETMKA